jgi:O-acetyl-ADP-ribose deacetylase (regulator of RNase III)
MIKFNLVVGDLGDQKADAIVTAATQELGPVSAYYADLFDKAGPELLSNIIDNGHVCEVGEALVTEAFDLNAEVLVHAVPPQLEADEDNWMVLLATYANAVIMGYEEGGANSIVIPPLGLDEDTKDIGALATIAYDGIFLGIGQCRGIKEVTLCMPNETAATYFKQVFKAELKNGWHFGPDCPKCGKPALPITYGLPSGRDFMDPNFYSGGCIIRDENPDWACRACEVEF